MRRRKLYGQTDAELVQRRGHVSAGLVRDRLGHAEAGAAKGVRRFTDRHPAIELVDFDALAGWVGYLPLAKRWQRQWLDFLAVRWQKAGETAPLEPQAVLDYLARNPLSALQSLSVEEAARSLEALREWCVSGRQLPLREVSARVFQGRSKILDSRDELLRLLGASPGQFLEAPIQLLVALPDDPGAIDEALFIENLVTFERLADFRHATWRHVLLVYASRFQRQRSASALNGKVVASTCRLSSLSIAQEGGLHAVQLVVRRDRSAGAILWRSRLLRNADFAPAREVFANAQVWVPGFCVVG